MDKPSIKPQPLIAEILPGFATILIVGASYLMGHSGVAAFLFPPQNLFAAVAGVGTAALLASWVVGTLLDTCRDLVECAINKFQPLNWEFLLAAPDSDIERLNDWYMAYYLLNGNYIVSGILILLLAAFNVIALPGWAIAALVLIVVILGWDAWELRKEMSVFMGTGLPHDGVYTRLGPSGVDPDGVGVFAIRDIKKGTYLFEPDDAPVVWIQAHRVSGLPREIRELYSDFGPFVKGKYGVPPSFNKLTVAWYVNEPKEGDEPNVGCDENLKFYALRDISKGKELTVDYSKYCEPPPEE